MNPVARFGPYALLRPIARSGIALSYAARWLPIADAERIVSVKLLIGDLPDREGFAEAFTVGMRVASRLNHVNVAQTFDAGRYDGQWYAVLEFVDGAPLSAIVDRAVATERPIQHDVATFVAAEICAALAYGHGRRDERGQPLDVVHADIRPRNVLLSRAGEVKVVDFGLARAHLDVAGRELLDEEDHLHYAAPELVRGDAYDRRVDVYAAGALAYALLSGRRPFEGLAGAELRAAAARGGVTPITDLAPSVPEPLAEIVMAALAADPDDRPKNAVEVRSALSAWLRRHAPGFGRHRLKAFLQKELEEAMPPSLPDGDWRALHRKDFVPHDTATVLDHEVDAAAEGYDERAPLGPLLDANPQQSAPPALPSAKPVPAATTAEPPARPSPPPRPTPPQPPVVSAASDPEQADAAPAAEALANEAAVAESDTATADAQDVAAGVTTAAEHPPTREPATTPTPPAAVAQDTPHGATAVSGDDADQETAPRDEVRPVESGPVRMREERRAVVSDLTGAVVANANVETFDDALADELAGAVYDDELDDGFGRTAVAEAKRAARSSRGRNLKPALATLTLVAVLAAGAWYAWTRAVAEAPVAETAVAASVFVTSRPQGATVSVDGAPAGTRTPGPVEGLEPGRSYEIAAALPGYIARAPQTISVEPGVQETVTFVLEPRPHTVHVVSEPAGASVWYDGSLAGLTPMALEDLRIDYREGIEFVVRLEGYFDERVPATWDADADASSVQVTLRPDPNWIAPEDPSAAGGR